MYVAEVREGRLLYGLDKEGRMKYSHRQPKCSPDVCEAVCPYARLPWSVDVVSMQDGRDAVVLLKDRGRGDLCGCVVMYLNRKIGLGEAEALSGRERQFMSRHVPRLMEDCPYRMEHELADWNRCR